VFVGAELHVPMEVEAPGGSYVGGVELKAVNGGELARCGFIAAGQSRNVSINLPATQRGSFSTLEFELRSAWPLGAFLARARLKIEVPHVVYPTPAGSQPMPEGEPGWLYDRRRGRGDGDEFAGLREFRPGGKSPPDSLALGGANGQVAGHGVGRSGWWIALA
jgi:uncharacterized protein (DUF58 family)